MAIRDHRDRSSTKRGTLKRALGNKIRTLVAGGVEPHAQALHVGLGAMAQRIEGLEARIEGLGAHIEGFEAHIEGLEARIEGLGARIEGLGARIEGFEARIKGLEARAAMQHQELRALTTSMSQLLQLEVAAVDQVRQVAALVAAQRDEIPWHRRTLNRVRETPEYAALWNAREPLITVRIPTWNNAEQLIDVAIASVLRQTYQRFEIVVVGDGCTDDTEARLRRLGDDRVRFENLPFRSIYPEDPKRRWMVAGTSAANLGVRMARGSWIAPLDDDDEFTDDHLEALLAAARSGQYEFAYGRFEGTWPNIDAEVLGAYPPQLGQVTLQAAMYPRLLGFFEFDGASWLLDEPGDWNLIRRMMEAGVRIGFVDRVVARLHPKGPR